MLLLSRRFSIILCLSALLLSACSVRPPKGVLSQSKMEDVLYDYHLAQSLAQQTSTDSLAHYTMRYRQAVYEKYGIDEATFQRSMEWYARHTDKLSKIYDRLAERYGCTAAILKERSPSCGSGRIYDGTFTGTLTDGWGVTAELLRDHGICVIGESEAETWREEH